METSLHGSCCRTSRLQKNPEVRLQQTISAIWVVENSRAVIVSTVDKKLRITQEWRSCSVIWSSSNSIQILYSSKHILCWRQVYFYSTFHVQTIQSALHKLWKEITYNIKSKEKIENKMKGVIPQTETQRKLKWNLPSTSLNQLCRCRPLNTKQMQLRTGGSLTWYG